MTATTMSRSRAESVRGSIRWLSLTAIFALAPKCLLCLAAYIGVGAAFGGPEICGAPTGPSENAIPWFALLVALLGLMIVGRSRARQERGSHEQRGHWLLDCKL